MEIEKRREAPVAEDAFDRMTRELEADVNAMPDGEARLAASMAMITVAANMLRRHVPVEHHQKLVAETKELLETIILGRKD